MLFKHIPQCTCKVCPTCRRTQTEDLIRRAEYKRAAITIVLLAWLVLAAIVDTRAFSPFWAGMVVISAWLSVGWWVYLLVDRPYQTNQFLADQRRLVLVYQHQEASLRD